MRAFKRKQSHRSIFSDAPSAASIQGDSTVVAGDDVTLTCSTDDRGNPEGTFKWKKPNGRTQDGKNLKIENLNVDEDEGDYECYVENDVAQGTSATHALTVNSELSSCSRLHAV
jgi:hypothetical protein